MFLPESHQWREQSAGWCGAGATGGVCLWFPNSGLEQLAPPGNFWSGTSLHRRWSDSNHLDKDTQSLHEHRGYADSLHVHCGKKPPAGHVSVVMLTSSWSQQPVSWKVLTKVWTNHNQHVFHRFLWCLLWVESADLILIMQMFMDTILQSLHSNAGKRHCDWSKSEHFPALTQSCGCRCVESVCGGI